MELNERILLISEIVGRAPCVGKTAMMKFTYLLQTLFHVPFDYDFEIYTYGPFCQTVMSDIEYAELTGMLEISRVPYSNRLVGYEITATEAGKSETKARTADIDTYSTAIDSILKLFGNKTAKELELYSTIVFIAKENYERCKTIELHNVCTTVKEIKPHFSAEAIQSAYEYLENHQCLKNQKTTYELSCIFRS